MNLLTKQKEIHRLRKQTYGCWEEGIVGDFGKVMYTLLYLKWITNRDILYSTWNSAQCYVPALMGGTFGREWIHVYVWLSPLAVHLKLSQLVNWLYPSTKCVCCLKKQNCAKRLRTLGIQHFISNRKLALGTNLSTLDSGIYHFGVDAGSRAPACP